MRANQKLVYLITASGLIAFLTVYIAFYFLKDSQSTTVEIPSSQGGEIMMVLLKFVCSNINGKKSFGDLY